ncbi:MAG TPA: alpha/beta fold hydrolase [Pyrinomonadaceae bacterium]|nr:alpha/beta fold hydrolase [Pyrinomonadaceae bacterium]
MKLPLIHALALIFAALLAGLPLPAFAQATKDTPGTPNVPEASGTYATMLGAQPFGTESYRIIAGPGGTRRSEAEAVLAGSKVRATTAVGADGLPASFTMELNGAPFVRHEYTAGGVRVEAGAQPLKPLPARPDVLLENGLWHHFHFLLARYDAARGGAQQFTALLPSQAVAFKVTLERVGSPAFDVKGRQTRVAHYRAATDLGLSFEVWADEAGVPLVVSVPAQSLRAVRGGSEDLAAAVFPPKPGPSDSDPYTSEEVTFTNGEQKLVGTLTVPKSGAGPHPAAVLISGSGAQDRDGTGVADIYLRIAETLSAAGMIVLRVDDRGAGKSTGPLRQPSYRDLVADSRAAFEYVLARREVDKSRVALVGHSEGAETALIIAAEDPRVAAVALLAGPSRPVDKVVVEQTLYQAALARPVAPSDRAQLSAIGRQFIEFFERAAAEPRPPAGAEDKLAWFREHAEHDPSATARKVRVPALVLIGDRDMLVLPYHALALAQAMTEAGNRRVTLRVLPGLTHLFTPADPSQGGGAGAVSAEFLKTLREWAAAALPAK